ncbi:hypothetical protein [Kribbella caucasensis]|uniref:hypothetical protein n=1 Tax=Kribbella caucasensis TaxID=2512215 RepID=UPI001414FDBE|nr:hypothetical protein [Kribbella sp. VKM Ac-2527]
MAIEANEYHSKPLGPAFVRYARDIRAQCCAIRLVLARYAEARDADAPEAAVLREVLADLATRFRAHPTHGDVWPPAPSS